MNSDANADTQNHAVIFPPHTPRLCVIFEVSQALAKSALFILQGASDRKLWEAGVRRWNCLHYMLQCFSNGLEHIKLKMNSRSSRHHVERRLSLHFPFSECSIITTAVTFIARVCVCLGAYTVFGPYVWIYLYACVHLCKEVCVCALCRLCAVALHSRSCVETKDHICLTPTGGEAMHVYLF